MNSKYTFTDKMREISGFGGGYEETCRKMVIAGVEWLDANPNKNPMFHSYANITGIIEEDNEDAKELSDVIVKVVNEDCTGAQHQACISHIMWIKKHSWNEYVEEMVKENTND